MRASTLVWRGTLSALLTTPLGWRCFQVYSSSPHRLSCWFLFVSFIFLSCKCLQEYSYGAVSVNLITVYFSGLLPKIWICLACVIMSSFEKTRHEIKRFCCSLITFNHLFRHLKAKRQCKTSLTLDVNNCLHFWKRLQLLAAALKLKWFMCLYCAEISFWCVCAANKKLNCAFDVSRPPPFESSELGQRRLLRRHPHLPDGLRALRLRRGHRLPLPHANDHAEDSPHAACAETVEVPPQETGNRK